MDDLLLIYEVQPSDTLLSIAQSIGMTADELRDFHNVNCQKVGLLMFNGFIGISKVVIPKNYKSPEQIDEELKNALPKPVFSEDFYANSYQVLETFDKDLNISYTVSLKTKSNKEQNSITLTKSNFKKNNISPDDKMSDIALACAQSMEPVILKIDQFGLPIEIQNHEQLKSDFTKQRPDLQEFYTGDVYAAYLNQFENNISDQILLLNKLRATLLYQILFPDKRWFYKKVDWTEDFFVLQNSFSLAFQFNVKYNLDSVQSAETQIRAENVEKYSLSEILKGIKSGEETDEVAQIEMKISYRTNKITKQLESATATVRFWHDGELYKEHQLTITQN